jgi:hypothetical protein
MVPVRKILVGEEILKHVDNMDSKYEMDGWDENISKSRLFKKRRH